MYRLFRDVGGEIFFRDWRIAGRRGCCRLRYLGVVVYRLFRDVEGESSISYGLQNCGTSGAPSPTLFEVRGAVA